MTIFRSNCHAHIICAAWNCMLSCVFLKGQGLYHGKGFYEWPSVIHSLMSKEEYYWIQPTELFTTRIVHLSWNLNTLMFRNKSEDEFINVCSTVNKGAGSGQSNRIGDGVKRNDYPALIPCTRTCHTFVIRMWEKLSKHRDYRLAS